PVVFGFSWSLATEEQFYLVFPPLLALLGSAGSRAALVLGFLLVDEAAEHGALSSVLGTGALFRAVTSISAPMCLGALAAIALGSARSFRVLASVLGRRLSSLVLLSALLGLVAFGAPLLLVHV